MKQKKKPEEEEFYVNKEEMWTEINRIYTETPKEQEIEVSSKIADMFYKICNNLREKGNFSGYSYDLASEAVELVIRKFKERKFKLFFPKRKRIVDDDGEVTFEHILDEKGQEILEPSNFFGYVTTMAYRSFQSTITREKKHKEGIEAYKEQVYSNFENDNYQVQPRRQLDDEEEW